MICMKDFLCQLRMARKSNYWSKIERGAITWAPMCSRANHRALFAQIPPRLNLMIVIIRWNTRITFSPPPELFTDITYLFIVHFLLLYKRADLAALKFMSLKADLTFFKRNFRYEWIPYGWKFAILVVIK